MNDDPNKKRDRRHTPRRRGFWPDVVKQAADIVRSYDTPVTVRQVYYKLLPNVLENCKNDYNMLCRHLAKARRESDFPQLLDDTRELYTQTSFASVDELIGAAFESYQLDHTRGQSYNICLAVEKRALSLQLIYWFGDYGIHIVAMGGYGSQPTWDSINEVIRNDPRPSVVVYAGDLDSTGIDIPRLLEEERLECDEFRYIGLTEEQVEQYELQEDTGKARDPRAARFIKKYGRLMQVELDALDRNILRQIYEDELFRWYDVATYDKVLAIERDERAELRQKLEQSGLL